MARPRGGGAYGSGNLRFGRFYIPTPVAVLMALTIVASIGGALYSPLVQKGMLLPPLVWEGEVWRLVTWTFYEMHPISLVFAVLMLYWFGKDLCDAWGNAKFLAVYFGFSIVVGALTCLIGKFVWHAVWTVPQLGNWPISEALVIAWATLFPDREISLYFVLRVRGRTLILITIGLTVLFALYDGFASFVPHFLAEGLMLLYIGQGRRWYLKWKMVRLQNQAKRYVDNVRRIDGKDDEEGPPGKPPTKWMN
jgi:membrane associated rhomboid family serine protease